MRKLPSPSQAADTSIIHHFSHPHPLQLFNHRAQQTHNLDLARWLCACCKLKVSDDSAGWIYTCLICNYFLHISCSKMPQQITHPIDQNHPLSLLIPNPMCILYPETQGFFRCDACGKQGNGFSYHCGTCNIDLHPICSTMPLTLTHQSHHHHHLNLTFSPPYNNKIFSCDICKNMGSKEWLYRCNMCEFDAHLVCATSTTKARAPIQQAHQQQQHHQHRAPTPPSVVTSYNNFNNLQVPGPTGTGYLNNGVQSYSYFNNDPAGPGVAAGRNMQQSGLSNQQVIRFLANATIPGLGLLMQGLSGGGGSSGDGSLSSFNVDLSGMDFGAMGMGGSDIGGFGGF